MGVPARYDSPGDQKIQMIEISTGDGFAGTQTRGWIGWRGARNDRLPGLQKQSNMPARGNITLGKRVSKICSLKQVFGVYLQPGLCRRPKALSHSTCENSAHLNINPDLVE